MVVEHVYDMMLIFVHPCVFIHPSMHSFIYGIQNFADKTSPLILPKLITIHVNPSIYQFNRSKGGFSHNTGFKTRQRSNRTGQSTGIKEPAIEKRMRRLIGK
jgi:hypothetical protein